MGALLYDLWPALAYGAFYVPFTILSARPEKNLPLTMFACWLAMVASMRATGLVREIKITREAVLCGLCTAGIILTTIVGYGLVGVSILLMALLQRGGVLSMAPILDLVRGTTIAPQSRLALFLTLTAVLCAVFGRATVQITPAGLAVVGLYLCCYAVRLHLYGAFKERPSDARRLLVSDQALAVTLAAVGTSLYALLSHAPALPWVGAWALLVPVGVGVLSQATGFFGSMVFAGRREHTYCAPLNRCASTLAVAVASLCMGQTISGMEWIGLALIVGAVVIMALPAKVFMKRASVAVDGSSSSTRG